VDFSTAKNDPTKQGKLNKSGGVLKNKRKANLNIIRSTDCEKKVLTVEIVLVHAGAGHGVQGGGPVEPPSTASGRTARQHTRVLHEAGQSASARGDRGKQPMEESKGKQPMGEVSDDEDDSDDDGGDNFLVEADDYGRVLRRLFSDQCKLLHRPGCMNFEKFVQKERGNASSSGKENLSDPSTWTIFSPIYSISKMHSYPSGNSCWSQCRRKCRGKCARFGALRRRVYKRAAVALQFQWCVLRK
jgi:hypothetical protein